jgi:hypothetical protein
MISLDTKAVQIVHATFTPYILKLAMLCQTEYIGLVLTIVYFLVVNEPQNANKRPTSHFHKYYSLYAQPMQVYTHTLPRELNNITYLAIIPITIPTNTHNEFFNR